MNKISTLNPNELMNTNDQLDSNLLMTESHDVSFGDTLKYFFLIIWLCKIIFFTSLAVQTNLSV